MNVLAIFGTIPKIIDFFKQLDSEKRQFNVEMTQLAFLLEDYAVSCSLTISDYHEAVSQYVGMDENEVEIRIKLPAEVIIPMCSQYKQLDPKIFAQLQEMPHTRRMMVKAIQEESNYRDDLEMNTVILAFICKIGMDAIQLAQMIRLKYKLEPRQVLCGGSEVLESLKDEFKSLRPSFRSLTYL
jgi:hypothetical protein